MIAPSGRPDLGKPLMLITTAVLLAADVVTLIHAGRAGGPLSWINGGLAGSFYILIIWCYLRRGPAVATSKSISAHIAAVAATWMPLVIPLMGSGRPGRAAQVVAYALLVAGMAWSTWTLRFLGRNLSVIAQAREVVESGPYRWVRHPLYTGELASSLGLAIAAGGTAALAAWLGVFLLQVYRALREEQVLLAALPGYRRYRSRTAAIMPGLF